MNAPARTWNDLSADEKRAGVRERILAGDTYREIADGLNAPRNSIAGVVNRLRTSGDLPPAMSKQATGTGSGMVARMAADRRKAEHRRKDTLLPQNIANKAESRKNDPGLTISRAAAWDALPGVAPVRLVDHQERQCRWPVDFDTDEPGHFFCGAACDITETYCDCHAALGSNGLPVRRKQTPAYA